MQIDDRKSVVIDFFQQFNRTTTALLLLDYDGTLAPFQTDRHQAYPYPGIVPILERIIGSGRTKLAIVSGRPVIEIQNLLSQLTDFEIWGAHGLEHLSADGFYRRTEIEPNTLAIIRQAEDWLLQAGLLPITEIKPGGIAVHWRGLSASEVEHVQSRIQEGWNKFEGVQGIKLLAFDGGIELRAARPDKGDVIDAILKTTDAATPVAFLGDDFTDEDAFRVLNGRGLSVLVRHEYRKTIADAWLQPPQELIDFLATWSDIAGMGTR
ncbi:trehalose-phosphatase [Alloacidobacterium dinghuense]|uniref:Trehalose 6-phosphate phosphatase n=1 Tax=Alloacidobacterium dinghuense TaxID=2763107 RepID=A0A7G8BD16_9BACT|nr:trehalose-phosphatase [Alloacidobacterium dinghuense]QNI30436.1 trehalose-phosphatase [Alloacidobacterium dinghuense]